VLEAIGLGLERGEEAAQVGAQLSQAQLDVAELRSRLRELGRQPLERRERPLGGGGERRGARPVLRSERVGGVRRALGELGHVAEPLALGAERLLAAGLQAGRRLDERGELGQPSLLGRRAARQLVVALPGRGQLAPGAARLAAPSELSLAAVGVEDVELVRRARETALLELPGHRDQALGRRSQILACDRAAPRVRARAPVGEDAPCDHETRLVLGRQLRERGELLVLQEAFRHVELGLDVCLAGCGADGAGVALGAEEQPDRLGQDRLAGAGLARDRRQAGRRDQLTFPHEHEVLDPKATKQRSGGSG
jgi:hypothetical protein